MTSDTEGSFVHAESRLVTAVGVRDLIIVETHDAVLVADKSRAQEVKQIVERLQREQREEENFHRIVYRPWGSFDSVDEGKGYKVKRISVKPGARLSKQMHHHRAEHWVVVRGTARVFRNDEIFDLHENESVFIPLGATHYLENPGDLPLDIIEVQSGSYLGEDDIVRFDDIYGRSDS
jgi:mannose-1-phosphate guanylyltransferase/mannose-6-phosphate isomerase